MFVIGITGLAGSGKDTVADMIEKHLPGAVRAALADPLKEFSQAVFGFTDENLRGGSAQRNRPDPRLAETRAVAEAAIRFGEVYSNWVAYALPFEMQQKIPEAKAALRDWFHSCAAKGGELTPRFALQTLGTEWGRAQYPEIWVDYLFREYRGAESLLITDVRFVNEAHRVRAYGGLVWRVTRPGVEAGSHSSETEQHSAAMTALVDVDLHNNSTHQHLEDQVIHALRQRLPL